jgi:MFS transporter, DHA1 family, multidrug resistance protein
MLQTNVMPALDDRPSDAVDAKPALVRLCVAGFLAYCSYAMCRSPLLPLFARSLGADAPTIGFVVGASTLTGIALKMPAGAWSDVLGRRPLLVAGALVFAMMPFAYLWVSTLAALIGLRFVHGSATAIFGPVASASLSDAAPADRRATWLSTYSTAQGCGQALAPVVAGYLIAGGRFDLAFVSAGAIGIAVPIIVARGISPRIRHSDAQRWRQVARGIAEVGRDRLILVTSAAQAAQFVLNGTLNAFLPLYGRDMVGLSTAEVGWLFGVQTATTLATRPLVGIASDRIGRRSVITAGLAVCCIAVFLLSMTTAARGLLFAVLVYAAGVATTTAATSAFITDRARRAQYGAAHGVFGTIYDVGDALGPIAAGLLVASLGYAAMFRVMALVASVATIAFWMLSREPLEGAA